MQIHPYPPLLKENGKYYPATYKTCEHFSPFSKIVPCRLPFPKAVHSTDCVMCLMVFCDYDIVADVLLLKAFCERRFDYGVKTPSRGISPTNTSQPVATSVPSSFSTFSIWAPSFLPRSKGGSCMVERARSSPGKEWTRGKGKGEYSPQEEKPR